MAPQIKKKFKDGIWIRDWKFQSDQNPFDSKMSPTAILRTRHKIEKFAHKTLKDRSQWKLIGENFNSLIFQPAWRVVTSSNKPMVLHLRVEILERQGPPVNDVIAPPPPKQPPPPTL